MAVAFRLSPHPIGVVELETGRCLAINDAGLETFGFRREEVIGRTTLWSTLWPDPQERVRLIERLKSERSVRNLAVSMQMKSGDRRQFLISTELVRRGRKPCLFMMCDDITEHTRLEKTVQQLTAALKQHIGERTAAWRKSEERFRTFLHNAPNLAFMKDRDGRYLYVNRRFQEAFRLEQINILGKTDEELFPREQARRYQANDRLVLESEQALEFEEEALYADGPHTSIAVKFPVRDGSGRIYATGGIVTDITDRKRTEDEFRRSQEELQQQRAQLEELTSKLITAQDNERQRIACDLHDDFSQRMAALLLDLAALEQRPPLLPESFAQELIPIREQLEQLSDDLHNLAYNLHPSLLLHAGLQPTVDDHVRRVAARTGLRILFKSGRIPRTLSHNQGICLFRVLQEALRNVVKHAKATEVTVRLIGSSKGIGLSVKDNGKGFDPNEKVVQQKGLGLISMRERLRLMNGVLNIHSRASGGTKVCAWIPLAESAS